MSFVQTLRRSMAALTLVFVFSLSPTQAQSAEGPSFNCRFASLPAERAICGSRYLARLDREMAEIYYTLRDGLRSRRAQKRLSDLQNAWLLERNGCGNRQACLSEKYGERITQLEDALSEGSDNRAQRRVADPSFDCRRAQGRVQEVICRRPRLAKLDRELDALYREVRDLAPRGGEARRLRREQRAWLEQRDQCRARGRCIRRAYNDRIADLQSIKLEFEAARRPRVEPSFSCRSVRRDSERTICDRPGLARLDNEMAALYVEVRDGYRRGRERDALVQEQRTWLAARNDCGQDVRCLRGLYNDRIFELEIHRNAQRDIGRAPEPSVAPSFNCRRARTDVEQLICSRDALARLDREMADVYERRLQELNRRDSNRLRQRQEQWLGARNACGAYYNCLRRAYEDRIYVLAEGADGPRLRRQ